MATLRDKFWLWGQTPGSHHASPAYRLSGVNKMDSVEGCRFFGIPNCCRVAMTKGPFPPFDDEAAALDGLKNVVWSVIGAGGVDRNEENCGDLDEVIRIAGLHSNVVGGIMDDFFHSPRRMAIFTPEKLRGIRNRLHKEAGIEYWTVYYDREMHLDVAEHLAEFDVITFWTWYGENLDCVEENLSKLLKSHPEQRLMAGCYMWDYGNGKPLGKERMLHQLEVYRKWLHDGRLDGVILCSNCIADLGIEEVEQTRRWLAEHGDEVIRESL